MPVSKVDSKSFKLAVSAEPFLSLVNFGKQNLTPPDFWKEIISNEEAVSSYIVCLITKLICLDSEHGLKPLPDVYRDLVELPVEYSKYKSWAAKSLPANAKSSAQELQFAIVRTIKHLKEWHGYTPNIHLRHMYLRWNLARNSDDARQADGFEETVIKAFSVAQAKEIFNSPLSSPNHSVSFKEGSSPMSDKDELALVKILVENVFYNHRRAQFGRLPPDQCRLCGYGNDNLSYIRLRYLVSKSPLFLNEAMRQVLNVLKNEVSHSQDYGDREILLPLLHLFRELFTMLSSVNTEDVYQTIMPFYAWPLAHSEFTKRVLDMILLEGKVRGTTYRRKIMVEQDLGVSINTIKIRQQLVHMMVDTSHPLSRGTLFNEIFHTQQEKPNQQSLQRAIIRNCFLSLLPNVVDVVEFEEKLMHLSSESLKKFCLESLELTERANAMPSDEKPLDFLSSKLRDLYSLIKQHTESDEQRDSAVSCSSIDKDVHFTEDNLSSFSLPPPHFNTSSLDNVQYPTVLVHLREILIKCQRQSTPKLSISAKRNQELPTVNERPSDIVSQDIMRTTNSRPNRPLSHSSDLSMDSTGSNLLNDDDLPPDSPRAVVPNGKPRHMTNGVDHVNGSSALNDENDQDVQTPTRPTGLPDLGPRVPGDAVTTGIDCLLTISSSTSSDAISKRHTSGSLSEDFESLSLSQSEDTAGKPNGRILARRQTFHTGMLSNSSMREGLTSSLNASSPGTRRYSNVASQSKNRTMSICSTSSFRGIQLKKSSTQGLSVKQRSRKTSTSAVASPTHKPNLKLVKVVLAGNDILVSHTARAYAYIRMEEPNLFSGLEIRFYHVPLSRASSIRDIDVGGGSVHTSNLQNPDLPEPMFEQVNSSGNDVHIGRFLAHMDSWYERNLMIAVHHLLRILPSDVPSDKPLPASSSAPRRLPTLVIEEEHLTPLRMIPTPSKILIDTVSQYTQEATNCIRIKLFRVKMSLRNEKTNKIEHREMVMLHCLDVQRLSGKKQSNRQVKPFEANITMTELTLDNSLTRTDMMEMTSVWAVRASNIPRAGDSGVPNPESESFELTIIKTVAESGRFSSSKHRFQEEDLHHACDLILETRDKPLTVMVDNDNSMLIENVIRMELSPAYMDQSFRVPVTSMNTRRNDFRAEQQMDFPLMTYWPIDL